MSLCDGEGRVSVRACVGACMKRVRGGGEVAVILLRANN